MSKKSKRELERKIQTGIEIGAIGACVVPAAVLFIGTIMHPYALCPDMCKPPREQIEKRRNK